MLAGIGNVPQDPVDYCTIDSKLDERGKKCCPQFPGRLAVIHRARDRTRPQTAMSTDYRD
jgi:hypothetical protein